MERKQDFIDECYKDKDLSLLKKLTLVIPTYNRNFYLSRCLWYHAHFPFGQIIIADSSPNTVKNLNRKSIENISKSFSTNITYLEYIPETDKYGSDIYKKWADAIQHVNMEYSVICTDREYMLINRLINNLKFLENNPNYGVIILNTIGQMYDKGEMKYKIDQSNSLSKEINQDNTIEKIMALEYLWPNVSSLYRSHIHKMIYNEILNFDVLDLRFGEILPGILAMLYHKISINESPTIVRDNCNLIKKGKLNKNISSSTRYPYLNEYILDGCYSTYYSKFETCLFSHLSKIEDTNNENTKRLILNILIDFMKKIGLYGWPIYYYKIKRITKLPIETMILHFPQIMKKIIRKKINLNQINYTYITDETSSPEFRAITWCRTYYYEKNGNNNQNI